MADLLDKDYDEKKKKEKEKQNVVLTNPAINFVKQNIKIDKQHNEIKESSPSNVKIVNEEPKEPKRPKPDFKIANKYAKLSKNSENIGFICKPLYVLFFGLIIGSAVAGLGVLSAIFTVLFGLAYIGSIAGGIYKDIFEEAQFAEEKQAVENNKDKLANYYKELDKYEQYQKNKQFNNMLESLKNENTNNNQENSNNLSNNIIKENKNPEILL